eukprot:6459979-Amphidinium_carterae.4
MILGLEKGRLGGGSNRGKFLAVCRRIASLLAVTDSRMLWRWIPSELNPADAGSREWEPNKHAKEARRPCQTSYPSGARKYQPQNAGFIPEVQVGAQRMAKINAQHSSGCLDNTGAGRMDRRVLPSPASGWVAQGKRTAFVRGHDFPGSCPGPSLTQQSSMHSSGAQRLEPFGTGRHSTSHAFQLFGVTSGQGIESRSVAVQPILSDDVSLLSPTRGGFATACDRSGTACSPSSSQHGTQLASGRAQGVIQNLRVQRDSDHPFPGSVLGAACPSSSGSATV